MNYNKFYFLFSILAFMHLSFYQIKLLDISDPKSYLNKFKSNNYLGFIIFINILIGNHF